MPARKNTGPPDEPTPANSKDKEKKQILLRISAPLWKDLAAWAEDDFRSINGQIEYLLHDCVEKRKKGAHRKPGGNNGDYTPDS